MDRPHCQSLQVVKNGREPRPNETLMQRYQCRDCGKQFNERTDTPRRRASERPIQWGPRSQIG